MTKYCDIYKYQILQNIFQRVALRLILLHLQPVHLSLLGSGFSADDAGNDPGQEEGNHVAAEASHYQADGSPDPGCHLGSERQHCCPTLLQLLHHQPQQQQVGKIIRGNKTNLKSTSLKLNIKGGYEREYDKVFFSKIKSQLFQNYLIEEVCDLLNSVFDYFSLCQQ